MGGFPLKNDAGSAAAPMRRGLKHGVGSLLGIDALVGQRCRPDEKGMKPLSVTTIIR
jgi:hypothetical protein